MLFTLDTMCPSILDTLQAQMACNATCLYEMAYSYSRTEYMVWGIECKRKYRMVRNGKRAHTLAPLYMQNAAVLDTPGLPGTNL